MQNAVTEVKLISFFFDFSHNAMQLAGAMVVMRCVVHNAVARRSHEQRRSISFLIFLITVNFIPKLITSQQQQVIDIACCRC